MAKKFNDWNSYLEDYYRRQREASGVTEQDHANYRAYYVSQQDGETLRQEAEAARDNLISAPRKVTSTHKALIDYSAALSKLDNYIALGGTVNGANNQYMQSLYDQYNKSWEEMQRMVQTNRQGFGNLGMQTAAGIAPNGVQVNQDALMGAFMPGRGLIDPKTGVPTEANQRAAQENAMRRQYQDIQSEAGQEAARWGAQAESAAGEKERVDKWMGIVSNLPETTDARIIASNEAWMRQAAEELGIESYTDKNDLLRKIRVQSQIFGAENTTATGRAEDYAAQQQTARAYEYQLDNPDESINANYYLALRDQAGRDAKTVDGFMDFLETPQEIGNWLRYNSAYGNQLYQDQKNEDILAIRSDPTVGPIYQEAMEAARGSGQVSSLRAQVHGEMRDNGSISPETEAAVRELAQAAGITVGQGDAALEAALEQMHQQYSHTVNTNMARMQAQGYDPERLRQYIQQALNEQRMDEQNAEAREYAAEHPVAASVGSSFTNVLSGGGYLATMPQAAGNMLAGITGNYDNYIPIDTNSVAFDQAQYVMNVRDEVTQRIVESGGSDFLYGVGMSMLDNVVQMAVGALTFGAPAMAGAAGQGAGAMLQAGISAASPATLSLMGLGAASQQLTQLTEEGVPSGQAYLLATLAGGVEIVTEKIGIDNLASALGRRQASQMLRNIVQQSIAEGAEEGLAEISNLASDYLVRLDDSEIMQMIEEGRQMGLTEEQARERARQTFTRQLMDAIAAGALSGLGFGGGAVVTHAASNTAGARGRQILAQDSLPQLQQQARYYGIDAAGITEESTARDIGSLYKQVEQAAQGAEQELRTWAADHKYNKDGTTALLHTFTEYTGTGAGKMSAREFSIAFDTAYQHGKSDAQFGAEGAYLERAANDGLTAGLTDSTVAYAYHAGIEAGKKLPKVKAAKAKQTVSKKKKAARTNVQPLAGHIQVGEIGEHDATIVYEDGSVKSITEIDTTGKAEAIVQEAMKDEEYSAAVVNEMLASYDGKTDPVDYYQQYREALLMGYDNETLGEAKKAIPGLAAEVVKRAHARGQQLYRADEMYKGLGAAGQTAMDNYDRAAPATFEKFYKAGLEGKSFRQAEKELGKVSDQIRDEMQAAVNAGLRDKQGGFEYGRQERGTSGNQEQGRVHGMGTGESAGQAGSMAETESGGESQTDGETAAGNERQTVGTREEKVSSKSLGLQHGTDTAVLTVIEEDQYSEEQKSIAVRYGKQDVSVVFVKGKIEIQRTDGGIKIARGVAVSKKGQIIVRVDADLTMEQIAEHEAKHIEFARYPDRVETEWQKFTENMSEEELDRWIAGYAERYGYLDGYYDIDQFIEEALCDAAAEVEAPVASEQYYQESYRQMAQKWRTEKATNLSEGAGYARQTDSGGIQFALGKTSNNSPVVIVETDILKNVPEDEWVRTVKKNLKSRFPNGISLGRNNIIIDSQSRKELTNSKYTKRIKDSKPDVYADKLRATNNADEILLATTDYVNEEPNHARKDKIDEFARGTVLIRIANRDYQAEVVVAHRKNGTLLLYDIVRIKETKLEIKETDTAIPVNPSPGAERNTVSISNDSVSNSGGNVKDDLYSIAGRNAATANLEALEQAEDLEVNGYTPGEIYRETGWFRGADGQWRFEIDDSTMRYTPERMAQRLARGEAYLDDVIEHPALFEAYPALREVAVAFAPMRKGAQGVFRRRENKIYLSDSLKNEPESTLIHEIQHAIQALEGFANGSSRAYWEQIVEQGGKIDSVRLRDANAAVWQFEADPANQAVIEAQRRLNEVWDKEGARAGNAVYAQLEAEGLAARVDEYEDLLFEQANAGVVYLSSFPTDLYENTAGEQEARDVQARRNMTAEQRRQTMPQTGTRDTVFAETSEAAMSEEAELTPEQELEAQKRLKDFLTDQLRQIETQTPDQRRIKALATNIFRESGEALTMKELKDSLTHIWNVNREKGSAAAKQEARELAALITQNRLNMDSPDAQSILQIRKIARERRVYLTQDQRKELDIYGGYSYIQRKTFGRVRLANDGTTIGEFYQELADQFPSFFPKDITTPAEQLMQLIDVITDGTEIYLRNPLDILSEDVEYLSTKILFELTSIAEDKNPAPAYRKPRGKGKSTNVDASDAYGQERLDKQAADYEKKLKHQQKVDQAYVHYLEEALAKMTSDYEENIRRNQQYREEKIKEIKNFYETREQTRRENSQVSELRRRLLWHMNNLKRMGKKAGPERQAEINDMLDDFNLLAQHAIKTASVSEFIQGMSTEDIPVIGYRNKENPYQILAPSEVEKHPELKGKKVVRMESLAQWYEAQKDNGDFIPDARVEKILQAYRATRNVADLSVNDMQNLLDSILYIENEIRTQNKLIDTEDRRKVYQMVQETINNVKGEKGTTNWLDQLTAGQALSPVRMMHRITGYHDDDPMYQAMLALQQGEVNVLDYQRRAFEMFNPFTQDKEFMKYLSGQGRKQKPIIIEGLDEKGEITSFRITPDMRVAMYLHSQSYANLLHIQRGGFVVPDYDLYVAGKIKEAYNKSTTLRLQPSAVRQITSQMTERELAYARQIASYYNKMAKKEINAVSTKLKGYEIARVDRYYPIEVDKHFVATDFAAIKYDGSVENFGFTHERMQDSKPILLGNASSTLARSVRLNATYVGMAIPMRNFNKLLRVNVMKTEPGGKYSYADETLSKEIESRWGANILNKYFGDVMAELSGVNKQSGEKTDALWAKLRSNYAGAVLSMNLQTAAKQMLAYPSAGSILGYKALAHGLKRSEAVNIDVIKEYSPLLWHRMQGYIDADLGEYADRKKHIPKIMNWNQAVDVAVVKRLWAACHYKAAQDNKSLVNNEAEWNRATAELFNRVMLESQANYAVTGRGAMLRSKNELTKTFAMFKTEPFQQFNVLYDAVGNLNAKKRQLDAARQDLSKEDSEENRQKVKAAERAVQEAKTRMGQAVPAVLISQTLEVLITFAFQLWRGRREEWENEDGELQASYVAMKLTIQLLTNMAGIVPFAGQVAQEITAMATKYLAEHTDWDIPVINSYGTTEPVTELLGNAVTDVKSIINTLLSIPFDPALEEGEEAPPEIWRDKFVTLINAAAGLSGAFGKPAENMLKELYALSRNVLIWTLGREEGEYWYNQWHEVSTASGHASDAADTLYALIEQGDMEAYQRVYNDVMTYKDEEYVQDAMNRRIRADFEAGDIDAETAMRLLQQVTGSEDPDELYWKVQGWDYMSQSGADSFSKYDPVFDAIYDGSGFEAAYQQLLDHGVSESDARSEIRSQIGAWYKGTSTDELTITEQEALQMLQTYGGKSAEDAAALVSEWKCFVDTGIAYNDIKASVLDGTITANQAEDMLQRYGGKTADEAAEAAAGYEFMRQHPELAEEYEPGFVQTVAEKYAKYGSGINVNVYAEFVAFAQNVSADQDENGNWVSGSRKAKVVAYIAAIPGLTPEQRNNLMLTDYSTYNLDDMPW